MNNSFSIVILLCISLFSCVQTEKKIEKSIVDNISVKEDSVIKIQLKPKTYDSINLSLDSLFKYYPEVSIQERNGPGAYYDDYFRRLQNYRYAKTDTLKYAFR